MEPELFEKVFDISIHVLHVEDDPARPRAPQSGEISIHVLHVEDDQSATKMERRETHFNPRPPCGGRPAASRLHPLF